MRDEALLLIAAIFLTVICFSYGYSVRGYIDDRKSIPEWTGTMIIRRNGQNLGSFHARGGITVIIEGDSYEVIPEFPKPEKRWARHTSSTQTSRDGARRPTMPGRTARLSR